MTKVLTKLELAIHILKNIAENGEWVNDLEYNSDDGWVDSSFDLCDVICMLENLEPNGYRVKQPKNTITYKIGDRFHNEDWGECLLCRVQTNKVCLIGLEDGNRWTDPVKVDDTYRITEEEFSRISGGEEFIKI